MPNNIAEVITRDIRVCRLKVKKEKMAVTCRVDGHSWGNEHSLDVQQERGYYQLFLFSCYYSKKISLVLLFNGSLL